MVRAYDEANTLGDWLAADVAQTQLDDWAVGRGTVGVDLGLPNPYADALRFPSIAGEPHAPAREQPQPAGHDRSASLLRTTDLLRELIA